MSNGGVYVLMALGVIGYALWKWNEKKLMESKTPEQRQEIYAQRARAREAREAVARKKPGYYKNQPLSQVGQRSAPTDGAGIACPKCGGTQFKPGRKLSTKVAFGLVSLIGQAHHVRCVTCGTMYQRG